MDTPVDMANIHMIERTLRVVWFKVDDKLHSHKKIEGLPLSALGLWTLAGSWCGDQLTDGHVTLLRVRRLGGTIGQARKLIEAGLWQECSEHEECFEYWQWEKLQPSKAEVIEKRTKEAEKKKRWRSSKSSDQQEGENVPEGQGESEPSGPDCSRPDPTRPDPNQVLSSEEESTSKDTPGPSATGERARSSGGKPKRTRQKTSVREYTPEFEQWWMVYPRREGKGKAFDSWQRAIESGVDTATLIRKAHEYVEHLARTRTEKRFQKQPTTWLNQECWNDEYDSGPRPAQGDPTIERYAEIARRHQQRKQQEELSR